MNTKLDTTIIGAITSKLWPIPNLKNKFIESWDQICAITDQIKMCAEQLNNLRSGAGYYSKVNEIIMFFTYSYILINAIDELFTVFDLKKDKVFENFYDSSSIFNQKGSDNKGTDQDYFLYLRSLVAGHPTNTSRAKRYLGGDENHFSPYIQRADNTRDIVTIAIYSKPQNTRKIIVPKNSLVNFITEKYNLLYPFKNIIVPIITK